jgi:hypothetical protein
MVGDAVKYTLTSDNAVLVPCKSLRAVKIDLGFEQKPFSRISANKSSRQPTCGLQN